ncbi:hypothetical protein MJO28_004026, partial [Puccinia striiformis f. sp. tritici]
MLDPGRNHFFRAHFPMTMIDNLMKATQVKLLLDRGKHIEKTMNSSCNILKEVMEQFGHTGQY